MNKLTKLLLAAIVSFALVGSLGAGFAMAEETEPDPEELLNESDALDDEVLTVWVDAEMAEEIDNTAGESDLTMTVYGINTSAESEVELHTETVTAAENTAETLDYEFTDADHDEYDEFLVTVDGVDDHVTTLDWGTTVEFVGGGGLGSHWPGGTFGGIPVILIVAVGGVGLIWYYSED